MTTQGFREMLKAKQTEGKMVCVGLDSDHSKIPARNKGFSIKDTQMFFNRKIVDATKDMVCAYKPNAAFYLRHGTEGLQTLLSTVQYIAHVAPDVPVILDAKLADIDNTNMGYVEEAFNYLEVHAITVHPYLGAEALRPFLERKDKGVFVLCRTSNSGSGELQDLMVEIPQDEGQILVGAEVRCKRIENDGRYRYWAPLYLHIAYRVATYWNKNQNCGLVVGATYPEELADVRKIVGDMPILVPGIGAQGGDLEATIKAGGRNLIINSSRGIIFASSGDNFAEAAKGATLKLHEAATAALKG